MRLSLIWLVSIFAAQIAFAAVDSTVISLAPPSTTVLTGIDVQRAGISRSGSVMLQKAIDEQRLAKSVSFIGLNVRRDLRHLLWVGLGQQPTWKSETAVIAHGTFDPSRLTSAARMRGASLKRYGGVTVAVQGK